MRVGLTDAQLARMREAAAQLLPDTCQIQTITNTSDGAGGWSETGSTVATVACRMDPLAARTRAEVEAAREATRIYYQLTVPYDAPVAAGRQIVHAGVTYQIAEVNVNASWPIVRRCRLVAVA